MSNIVPINAMAIGQFSPAGEAGMMLPFSDKITGFSHTLTATEMLEKGIIPMDTGIHAEEVKTQQSSSPLPANFARQPQKNLREQTQAAFTTSAIGRFWGPGDDTQEDPAAAKTHPVADRPGESIAVEAIGFETNSMKKNQYFHLRKKKEKNNEENPKYYFSPDTFHKVPESQVTSYFPIQFPISLQ